MKLNYKLQILGGVVFASCLLASQTTQATIVITNGSYTVSTPCSTSEVTLGGSGRIIVPGTTVI
ncbi:MAG: hypothetical protein ACXWTL_04810 [Methylobacter sp.]